MKLAFSCDQVRIYDGHILLSSKYMCCSALSRTNATRKTNQKHKCIGH